MNLANLVLNETDMENPEILADIFVGNCGRFAVKQYMTTKLIQIIDFTINLT